MRVGASVVALQWQAAVRNSTGSEVHSTLQGLKRRRNPKLARSFAGGDVDQQGCSFIIAANSSGRNKGRVSFQPQLLYLPLNAWYIVIVDFKLHGILH
jgi:hypothetical protein